MAEPVEKSTLRRLVRFSDAVRDAVQNRETFGLTPDEQAVLTRIVERVDQRISRSRNL